MATSQSDDDRIQAYKRFLTDPATHGVPASEIAEPIETHGAIVVLAGERAFKIKKPVKFPYMDFSTLKLRRTICLREIEVNRRTAPEVYLHVAGIVETGGALRLIPDVTSDPTAEPVVVMRRFNLSRTLDRVVETEDLEPTLCDALVDEIASLQRAAAVHKGRPGSDRITGILKMNAHGLRAGTPSVLDETRVERLITSAQQEGQRGVPALDRRGRTGRIRRCHGDLHLGNIFLNESGRPVLFDAIEFDEDLATIDVAYDLAFLLMDLLHRGMWAPANRIWNRWLEQSLGTHGDDAAAALLPLFLSMRAAIRAEVGAAKANQQPGEDDLKIAPRTYLQDALDYLTPHSGHILAVGGLSGTGKSTLARALAPHLGAAPGATILRSDAIRKRLAGVPETDRLPATGYSKEMSARVYGTLHRRAGLQAKAARATIADAVYGRATERRRVRAVAHRAGVPFTGIWLELPVAEAKSRVAARRGDVSDATPEVVDRQAGFTNAPEDWLRLDASRPTDDLVGQVLEHLKIARRH
jgi:uncharacterized protein